jgi:hypothetical protein
MAGTVYLFVIGLSVIFSLLYIRWKKDSQVGGHGIILAILILVLIFESIGKFTAGKQINNSVLYNVCWVYLESFLLIFYFYQFEKRKTTKKIILRFSIILLLWGIVNSVFFQSISSGFQYYSFLPNSLFILVLCLRFLSQILNIKIFKDWNLIALPHFWISTAILFFYTEAIIVFGMYQFSPQFVTDNVSLIFGFNRLMAGMMYLIFGFAFFLPGIFKRNFNEGNTMLML